MPWTLTPKNDIKLPTNRLIVAPKASIKQRCLFSFPVKCGHFEVDNETAARGGGNWREVATSFD